MFSKEKHLISKPLVIVLLLIAIISCVAIAGATPYYKVAGNFWFKQAFFYVLAFIIMFAVYKYGNDRIYNIQWIFYWVIMVLLVGLVINRFTETYLSLHIIPFAGMVGGGWSWYKLPGFSLQPSEFMKIAMVLCLSTEITNHNNEYPMHSLETDIQLMIKCMKIALPPCILIYLQNDTGVTLILLMGVAFILFASGIQERWFIIGISALTVIILIAVYIFIYHHQIFVSLMGGGYKMGRFYGWLDPEGTASGDGYQLWYALLAYGSAGLTGHGFMSSVIYISEAQTDFIFAVICQDFGFLGGIATILLIGGLDYVLLNIGLKSFNQRDKYFVAGIFGMLIFQQIWNVGMVMGLFPITGITLPLISYGGSSLLSYFLTMGMFLDIEKQTRIVSGKNRDY